MSDLEQKNTNELDGVELFPGDTGTLPERVRRVLVSLLRNSYISSERNSEDWPYLVEYRSDIKSSLNDLFLELHVDDRNDIAFCLPVAGTDDSFPKLKREREMTDIQSLLIVFLRQQYLSQISSGSEKAWVGGDDMREYLNRLFAEGVVNYVRAASTVDATIDHFKRYHYIEPVKEANDRYRILPIVETAFPLEKVHAILEAYEKEASGGDAIPEGEKGEQHGFESI